jgi:hypothetical protein
MKPQPIRRQDRAIRRTAAQRAQAAAITADDVLRMRHWWPGVAPEGAEGLVEARVKPEREAT